MKIKVGNLYLSYLSIDKYNNELSVNFTSDEENCKIMNKNYLDIVYNILIIELNLNSEDISIIFDTEKVGSDNE